jgi:hypothetical protein
MIISAPSSRSSSISLHGLAAVGRIHLVAPPVAELRASIRRLRGTARRIPRRTWRRRPEWNFFEAVGVQSLADGAHAAVHHVGRGHDIGAGAGVRHGRAASQGRVVSLSTSPSSDKAAVPVAGVLAVADVGHDQQTGRLAAHGPDGALHDAVIVHKRPKPTRPWSSGSPNRMTPPIPSDCTSAHSLTNSSTDIW